MTSLLLGAFLVVLLFSLLPAPAFAEDTTTGTPTVITGTIAVFQIVPTETATAKVQIWKLQVNPDFVQQIMVFVVLLYILRFFWRLFE